MNFLARPITEETLQALLNEHALRHFYTQERGYARVKQDEGSPTQAYVLENAEDGSFEGVALAIFYRYKRILWRAELHFGPVLRNPTPERLVLALTALRKELFRKPLLRYLRVNPMVVLAHHPEINQNPDPGSCHVVWNAEDETRAQAYETALAAAGFVRDSGQWFNNPLIQVQILYNKPLGSTFEETLASLSPVLRNRMNKSIKDGIQFRTLTEEELPAFDAMMESTLARKNTIGHNATTRYRLLMRHFGKDMRYVVTYIDAPALLERCAQNQEQLLQERAALVAKYGEEPENKKGKGLLKNWQVAFDGLQTLIQRVEKLQQTYGDRIDLNAGAYFHCGQEWIYLMGAGYADRMFLNGSPALHYHMMQEAHRLGCTHYNLFGCSGLPKDRNDIDDSVMRFKETFLGEYEELLGTFLSCKSWTLR